MIGRAARCGGAYHTVASTGARAGKTGQDANIDTIRGGHIPGAIHHFAGAIHHFAGAIARGSAAALLDAGCVAVICGYGYRSSVAAGILQGRGRTHLVNVIGGMEAWAASGLPTIA